MYHEDFKVKKWKENNLAEFLWKPEEKIPHPYVWRELLADDVKVRKVPKSLAVVSQVDNVTAKFLKSFLIVKKYVFIFFEAYHCSKIMY